MRRGMFVTGWVAAGIAGAALAGGFAVTRSLEGGVVAVTNAQANGAWSPVAVLLAYGTPATGTVSVARVSGGVEFPLGARDVAGATGLVWVADAPYPFTFGDALVVRSAGTNGTAQVILKGE